MKLKKYLTESLQDVSGVRNEKEAEKVLKSKGKKWTNKKKSEFGGILYLNGNKDIAMWDNKSAILTIF